jgi:hypothetical protein
MLMGNFVSPNITTLSKSLMTNITRIRFLASMTAFMGLQVPKLRKTLATGWFLAKKWFITGVSARMYIQMGLLRKTLSAVR